MSRSSVRPFRSTPASIFLIVLTCLLAAAAGPTGGAQPARPDADRTAWRYTQRELTVTLLHRGGKEWVAERSDGERVPYDEVERTAEAVTLQNRQSKLFVRLHADQAFWRRPRDERWTPWVKGGWIRAAAPPAERPMPAERPAPGEHRVRLAYFVPRDRNPAARYAQKIRIVMAIVGELYLQDLRSKGVRTDGLRFETENNEPGIRLVRGERDATYYNNAPAYSADEQWRRLLPEIRAKVGNPQKQVLVVFSETWDDGPAAHLWPGVIARGSYFNADGGLAVFASHLLRDEFSAPTVEGQKRLFLDPTPVPGRKAWGHRMNSPRGEFVEDGIGAVAHELGHALGLPHDRRDDAHEIMGNGFRNLRRNFEDPSRRPVRFSEENGWLLSASRYLARDLQLADQQPPQVAVAGLARDATGWTLAVRASDNAGLRALVVIDRTAGSILAGQKLAGKAQELRQRLPLPNRQAGEPRLQLIVTDDGGNQARVNWGGPSANPAAAPGDRAR